MKNISGDSLIAGIWKKGEGEPFSSHNPATEEKLKEFKGATTAQVNTAVEGASEAYVSYKTLDFDQNANFLEAIAEELENLGDELLEICNLETGLGLSRLAGERNRTCGQIRAFAGLVREGNWQRATIDTAIPHRQPLPKADIRKILMPLGPIGVFSASNFPLAFSTLGGDTASALAAGNTVIVKGHPGHPGTSELCAKAIVRALERNQIPKAVFSLLQGASPQLSSDLVKHPKLQAVGFTGSIYVGRLLYNMAAARPRPISVFAEMGSSNPLFLLPNALKENARDIAKNLAGSITLGTGQFCTKPGLIFAISSVETERFKNELRAAMSKIQIGNFLNKNIKSGLKEKIVAYKDNVKLSTLIGGTEAEGTVFTVKASDFIGKPKLEEEIFGPAALLVECDDSAEMMKAVNQLGGHLTGTIHTKGDHEAGPLKAALEEKVGRIIFNGFPTGVEVCPSMHHGGPYPSSTSNKETSVGVTAIERFCRVVCYQSAPQEYLPEGLKDSNPRGIMRLVNGKYTSQAI